MAKGKKGVDGIEKVIELFPAGSHKMIERLLAKAADYEAKQAGRNVKAAMSIAMGRGSRSGAKIAGGLAANLAKALRQRGDVGGNRVSLRQTAPDTNGRPFHFAHSVVSKEDASPAAAGNKAAAMAGGRGKSVSGGGKTGRAAAHMRYIEREIAVERTYGEGLEGAERPGQVRDHGREVGDVGPEIGRSAEGVVHATGAQAGQGYIENPVKLANGEKIVFSFGTIGNTFEERVAFWEALEEAEAHPSARVQHRLIVELPHEASPQARFDMVKTFAKRFEDDGIPYWAALHAPGKDNDSRNYHAHIVYSERPAKRMVDPAGPGDRERWDFEIVQTYRTSSRNTKTTRPFRQAKARAYTARSFMKELRKEFSDTVNAVLVRDDVRDKAGAKVLYDARSYKDMGVDAVPMRSINRIVADKMKAGQLTVLDGDYTRRMIAVELREAVAKRQKGVMDLIALDDVLRATATSGRPLEQNARLPKDLRISPWANPTKVALRAASRKLLEARHEALHIDVMERATTASLDRIIAATAPKVVAAAAKNKDPVVRAQAASAEAAALLHAAALDELAETRASTAKARKTMAYRVGNAVNEWRALVGAKPTEISPAVKAAIREMDRREAGAERTGATQTETGKTVSRRAGGLNVGRQDAVRKAPSAARADDVRSTRATSQDVGAKTEAGKATTVGKPVVDPGQIVEATRTSNQGVPREPAGPSEVPARAPAIAKPRRFSPEADRPKSMEDSLRIPMPTTPRDLQAASEIVSGWIRTVMEQESDVDRRMEMLDGLVKGLKADVRKRQGRPPATDEGPLVTGYTPAARLVETVATPDVTAIGVGADQPETRERESATKPRESGITSTGSATEGTTKPDSPGRLGDPKAERRAEDKVVNDPHDGRADTSVKEDPDDERRRKKRERELEKRKRQRQAVLGRKNRDRNRGR